MAQVTPLRRPPTILILTASMGAGHDGVAAELARRIGGRGYAVEVIDLLDVLPGMVGRGLRSGYSAMLRWAPWLYEAIYRMWFSPGAGRGGPVSPLTILAERRIRRWVTDNQPVAAVSTFHLCSTVLGGLRRKGVLRVPVASTVVDMSVHRLWIDPDVDLHLCIHPRASVQAKQRGAARACAPGPVVRPCFTDPVWDRRSARASLGLAEEERVVLLVAGSWGTGDIEHTLEVVSRSGQLTAMVVCGSDLRLQRRLSRQSRGNRPVRVMGWVEDMARLMAAADVVLENAGGLTSMEALAMGVPVVSFHPIPGHGRANVAAMAASGLLAWASRPEELVPTLLAASTDTSLRAALIQTGRSTFARDAADDILELLADAGPEPGQMSPMTGNDLSPSRRVSRPGNPDATLPSRPRHQVVAGTGPRAGDSQHTGDSGWGGLGSPRHPRQRRRRRLIGRVPGWPGRRRPSLGTRARVSAKARRRTSRLTRAPAWRPVTRRRHPNRRASRPSRRLAGRGRA